MTGRNPCATLDVLWSVEKMLRMFACVALAKLRYPSRANSSPMPKAMNVDHFVTRAHHCTSCTAILRYTANEAFLHAKTNDITPKPANVFGRMKVLMSNQSIPRFSVCFRCPSPGKHGKSTPGKAKSKASERKWAQEDVGGEGSAA